MTLITGLIQITAVGDDHDTTRTVPNLSGTLYLTQAWMYVKRAATDADGAAVIAKSITTAASPGVGQITDSGASSTLGALLFQIMRADTLLLVAGFAYTYAIKVKLNTNREFTIETGTLTAGQQIISAS